jgi:hypothetical protein
MMLADLAKSNALMLGVLALIILILVIACIVRGGNTGCAWLIAVIIAAILTYLFFFAP